MSFQTAFSSLITKINNNFTFLNNNLYGKWTSNASQVAGRSIGLEASTDYSISLSSYLPNDNNLYEVDITARVNTTTTNGQASPVQLSVGDYGANIMLCYSKSTGTTNYSYGFVSLKVKYNTTVKIKRDSSYKGTVDVWLLGYRKVR